MAASRRPESLDRIHLTLLHLHIGVVLDTGHSLTCVDFVGVDRVPIEVLDHLDRVHLAPDLHLVGLHGLLDIATQFTDPNINACLPHTSISGILDRLEQFIVHWVESHREGSVNNASVDMRTEVDLHHIVVVQDSVVSGIGSVVRGYVVDRAACREGDA